MKDYISCHPDWQHMVTDVLIQGSDIVRDIPTRVWDDFVASPDIGDVSTPCFSEDENPKNQDFEIGVWEPEQLTAVPGPADPSTYAPPGGICEATGESTWIPSGQDRKSHLWGWWTFFCPLPFNS